uniref:uncharacterized protein LOC122605428 n=1 Tax=Erigeron canadensis TaxID=72917 RepID=UPI001CB993BC|nr:uncharacterized protein LOC122605428 [Erigeron canadensis]
MATTASKSYFHTPNFRFFTSEIHSSNGSSDFELDESDIYNVSVSPEIRKTVPTSRISKRSSSAKKRSPVGGTASSLPVSVPDWSKILKQDYTENRNSDDDDFTDDDYNNNSGEDRIPPHEFLARTRMASFSVHEGIGRTLKGRDLSRVRNAIFEITGFQD